MLRGILTVLGLVGGALGVRLVLPPWREGAAGVFESARPWRVRGPRDISREMPDCCDRHIHACPSFAKGAFFFTRAPEVNLLSGPWRLPNGCPCNMATTGMPTGCKWTTSATSPVKAASLDRFFGWPWDCGSFASERIDYKVLLSQFFSL